MLGWVQMHVRGASITATLHPTLMGLGHRGGASSTAAPCNQPIASLAAKRRREAGVRRKRRMGAGASVAERTRDCGAEPCSNQGGGAVCECCAA